MSENLLLQMDLVSAGPLLVAVGVANLFWPWNKWSDLFYCMSECVVMHVSVATAGHTSCFIKISLDSKWIVADASHSVSALLSFNLHLRICHLLGWWYLHAAEERLGVSGLKGKKHNDRPTWFLLAISTNLFLHFKCFPSTSPLLIWNVSSSI